MSSLGQAHSLFEIDRELDTLLDEIEEEIESHGEVAAQLLGRFQQFCEAHGEPHWALLRALLPTQSRINSFSVTDQSPKFQLNVKVSADFIAAQRGRI